LDKHNQPPTLEKPPDTSEAEDWLNETTFIFKGHVYEIQPDMTVRLCEQFEVQK
jgi:hypothetical protein